MTNAPVIYLTRPEGENESLAAILGEYDTRIHPLIKLSALEVSPSMRKAAQDLDQVDKLIFVSKSAVRFTMPLLDGFWPQWQVTTAWFAVGSGTAEELAPYGIPAAYPEMPGSEGLLALEALQDVAGMRVVIVRGKGGRALISEELTRRGADVSYLETYERQPVEDPAFADLPTGAIVVVTSIEILQALITSAGAALGQARLVTASERIESAARVEGLHSVRNAGGASDQALYDAIVDWR